jgi:hypothetical protein
MLSSDGKKLISGGRLHQKVIIFIHRGSERVVCGTELVVFPGKEWEVHNPQKVVLSIDVELLFGHENGAKMVA